MTRKVASARDAEHEIGREITDLQQAIAAHRRRAEPTVVLRAALKDARRRQSLTRYHRRAQEAA